MIEKGRTRIREVRLRSAQTTIGREKGCGVRIPSKQVSRKHCLLSLQDGYLTVEDLDSVNGTILNGQKITGRQVVRPGDRLEIGPIGFVVAYQLSQEAIDHMVEGSPRPASAAEELDVLPLHEDETSTEQPMALEEIPMGLADEDEDLPVLEPLDDDHEVTAMEGWQLPEAQALEDLAQDRNGSQPPEELRRKPRRRR